jgi:hypothetical protein
LPPPARLLCSSDRGSTTIDDVTPPPGILLARYDATIARHATAAAFLLWRDRLLLLLGGALVIAAWRTWLTDHPPAVQRWAVAALGGAAGFACGRWVIARLRHHAADGPLAAAALDPASRLRYAAIGHAAAASALAAIVAVARPELVAWSLAAWLIGAGLAHLAPALDLSWVAPHRAWRRVAAIRRSYSASAIAALAFAAALAASTAVPAGTRLATIGVAAALPMLVLTAIDEAVVRFMAMAGHGVAATIGRHARAGALFTAMAAILAFAAAGPAAAALALTIGVAAMAWLTVRVILYRLYARRLADVALTGIAAAMALIAMNLPIALPFVAAIFIRHAWRRAAERRWLIA